MFSELPLFAKLLLGALFFFAGYAALAKLDEIDWDRYWPLVLFAFIICALLAKFG
ncbi:MAG: hypothetical protein WAU86_12820 [Oricola sp.]